MCVVIVWVQNWAQNESSVPTTSQLPLSQCVPPCYPSKWDAMDGSYFPCCHISCSSLSLDCHPHIASFYCPSQPPLPLMIFCNWMTSLTTSKVPFIQWFATFAEHQNHLGRFKTSWCSGYSPDQSSQDPVGASRHQEFVKLAWSIRCPTSTIMLVWDFPGGPVIKNLPAHAEDMGPLPGMGRFHMPRSS